MIQSFQPSREYGSVIIDEGHHVCASQYQKIFDSFPSAVFVALTATPYRMDGVGLGSCGFTKLIHGPDIFDLTHLGFLAPAKTLVPISESQGAWSPEATARQIVESRFRKAIVYCRSVSDATETANICSSMGIKAKTVHGGMDEGDRALAEKSFRVGKVNVLCNHTIYTEGYDVPSVDLIVLSRFTESRCLWRQMTGRGLRLSEGKDSCTILDLAGNAIAHGSIYDREIYDLTGHVESTESRHFEQPSKPHPPYIYNPEQALKEWKPSPKPISIRESLQRLKSKSPLHRLLTA